MLSEEPRRVSRERAKDHVARRLESASKAFRTLHETLRTNFSTPSNDADTACVFDRAASRVCKSCPLQTACWQRDYVSTFNALNDALPAMLQRGRGVIRDFPDWFTAKCMHFPALLAASNEELNALRYRQQYKSRLQENRAAVCSQYEELAGVLGAAAAELSTELSPDPIREKRLRQHLLAQGMDCRTAVYYNEEGHLRAELEGENFSSLRQDGAIEKLSAAVGVALHVSEEDTRQDRLVLVQCEPLKAVAGVAACRKDGETVSGDTGTWFKREDGVLYMLLCDGMGSGVEAGQESTLAVRLLEQFLRAGIEPEMALRTVSAGLGLRGEETGAFTSIDLLEVNLFTGESGIYKYGAGPTYLKKGKTVTRIAGTSLPAGLSVGAVGSPDVSRFRLEAGDCVLLITDGVVGTESDLWLRERLTDFDGESPKVLAGALVRESENYADITDDRTALLLQIRARPKLRLT